ncbi:MAG: hypothetical protein ACK5NG_02930, partial [Chthoniobacterales bacterium]
MRFLSCTLIVSAAAIAQSLAGGFGGPAPFQNNSPLTTGTDGTYQASMTGDNLAGVLSFAISSGSQTTTPIPNSWVTFYNGSVYRGQTAVNIQDKKITGVLDASTLNSSSDAALTLPLMYTIPNNTATGAFSGKIDLQDPTGRFHGTGDLYPGAGVSSTLYIIDQVMRVNP